MAWGELTHLDNNVINPNFTQVITSNNVRNRILNTISAEAHNQTFGAINPKGTVCNK